MNKNKILILSIPLLLMTACGNNPAPFNPNIPEYDDDVVVDITSISLSLSDLGLKTSKTHKLEATVKNYKGEIAWASSDNQIASVDANGVVTAIKEGKALITASIPGHIATCLVTVETYNDIPFINLGSRNLSIYYNDESNNKGIITPKVYFEGNDVTSECTISCSLDDGQASDVASFAISNKSIIFTSLKEGNVDFVIGAKYKDILISSTLSVFSIKKLNSIPVSDKDIDLDFEVVDGQLTYLDNYEIPLSESEQTYFTSDVIFSKIIFNDKVFTTGASYSNAKKALIISKDIFEGIKYGIYSVQLFAENDAISTNLKMFSDIITDQDELIHWHNVAEKIAGGVAGTFDGSFKLGKSFNMSDSYQTKTLFQQYIDAMGRGTSLKDDAWRSQENGFKGVFDGNGYAIIDLNNGRKQGDGFIFNLNKTGVLKNIAFNDYHITNPTNAYNGCIVAFGEGTIENVYVKSYLQKQSAQNNDFSGFFNYNNSWVSTLREAPTYRNVLMDFTPIETTASATVELGGFVGGAGIYKSGVGVGQMATTENVYIVTTNDTVKNHLFFKNPDKKEYATLDELPGVSIVDKRKDIKDEEWISNWNKIWKVEDPKIIDITEVEFDSGVSIDMDLEISNNQLVKGSEAPTGNIEISLSDCQCEKGAYQRAVYLDNDVTNKVSYDSTNDKVIVDTSIFNVVDPYDAKLFVTVGNSCIAIKLTLISDVIKTEIELVNWHLVANKLADEVTGTFDGYFKLGASFTMTKSDGSSTLFSRYLTAINRPSSLTNDDWRSPNSGFKGVFDGDGYAIDDLSNGKQQGDAFIFNLNSKGVVKNLAFTNYHKTNPTNAYNGCIVAFGAGTLENVYIDSNIVKEGAGNNTFCGVFNYATSWVNVINEGPKYNNVIFDFTKINDTAEIGGGTTGFGGFAGAGGWYNNNTYKKDVATLNNVFAITTNAIVKDHLFSKKPNEYYSNSEFAGLSVVDSKSGITDTTFKTKWNAIWKVEDPKIN